MINCAAFTVVDDCETEEERATAINGAGAGHAAAAARAVGARCLHVSTDYVFDGSGSEPYRTDDPTGPISGYGRSKLAGEEAVLSHDASAVVRTSWLFGPGGVHDGPNFVNTMLWLIEQGKTPLRVVDDQVGCADLHALPGRGALGPGRAGRRRRGRLRRLPLPEPGDRLLVRLRLGDRPAAGPPGWR